MKNFLVIIILLSLIQIQAKNQLAVPNDPAGDISHLRRGFMDGNRVFLMFRNTTELGHCCNLGYPVAQWPNDYNGTKSHDGIWFLVGARVFIDTTGGDVRVVESIEEARAGTGIDTLYFIQSHTRDGHDQPQQGGLQWGQYPVGNYMNLTSETPAMSNKDYSWPTQGWPAVNSSGQDTLIYPGSWNGRFGQDIFKADLSCYFVSNDAHDLEKIEEPRFANRKYFPRGEDFKIGSIDPNISIQNGKPWGGIGARVAVRGYQWSNPQAQDAIFWEYNVSNISDYKLSSMFLGFHADNAVGGEEYVGADDVGYYKIIEEVNMCFVWDKDFIPVGGGKEPGVIGFAFLESPGIDNDGIDNDNDGIIDEKRNNSVQVGEQPVGPYEGIDDIDKFLEYYDYDDYTEEELITALSGHYASDEDKDWQDWFDINENGVFDVGEPIGDDVGTDGIGPYDIWYTQPDANGTECNHRPDCIIGLGSEPNFGTTDVSETDLLGLQNFNYICSGFKYYTWGCEPGYGICSDINCFSMHYERITSTDPIDKYDKAQKQGLNFLMAFSSGMFEMESGSTERLSLSELHAYDPLAGLEASDPQAPALTRLAEVVNKIYEADYRFAQPPIMPELKAIPGDTKVILTWDNKSETMTREVMLQNKNDFEGYKIYRATDKHLSDPMVITDLNGGTVFRKPIFQCDINDGKVGPVSYGHVNGTGYNLGNDTGLQHSFIDTTVQNGITYYYAIVAYDYGLPNVGTGISPSENRITINKNEAEQVIEISKNVAIVTPFQKAAGYLYPGIDSLIYDTYGTGYIIPTIIDKEIIIPGEEYKIKFQINEKILPDVYGAKMYWNNGMKIYNSTNEMVYEENNLSFPNRNIQKYFQAGDTREYYKYNIGNELKSDLFDGILLKYYIPCTVSSLDTINSEWRSGSGKIKLTQPKEHLRYLHYDYEIIFDDNSSGNGNINRSSILSFEGNMIPESELLFNIDLPFYVTNLTFAGTDSATTILVVHDLNGNGSFDMDYDKVYVGAKKRTDNEWGALAFVVDFLGAQSTPSSGDSYFVTFQRGFTSEDEISFRVKTGETFSKKQLKKDMEKIKVVPNPYIITNNMEPSVMNEGFNQRRKILFTHIPAQCIIKIFTISGILVDEIDVNNTDFDDGIMTNSSENGTIKWDVLSKEGLEVGAGYYIYHVKSKMTGKEKIGKFAIIK